MNGVVFIQLFKAISARYKPIPEKISINLTTPEAHTKSFIAQVERINTSEFPNAEGASDSLELRDKTENFRDQFEDETGILEATDFQNYLIEMCELKRSYSNPMSKRSYSNPMSKDNSINSAPRTDP